MAIGKIIWVAAEVRKHTMSETSLKALKVVSVVFSAIEVVGILAALVVAGEILKGSIHLPLQTGLNLFATSIVYPLLSAGVLGLFIMALSHMSRSAIES